MGGFLAMSCTLTDRSRQPRRHDALQRSKLLTVFIRQPRNYLCERLFNLPRKTWSNPSECSQQLTRRVLCRCQLPVGYMPQNDWAAPMVKSPVRPRCPIHGHHYVLPAESQHVGSCTPVWRDRLTPKGCQRPYCIFLIRRTATVRCFQGSHIYTLVNSYQVIAANKPGQSLPDGGWAAKMYQGIRTDRRSFGERFRPFHDAGSQCGHFIIEY